MLAGIFFKQGRLRPWLRIVVYILAAATAFELLAALVLFIVAALGIEPSGWTLLIGEISLSALVVVGLAVLLRRYLDERPSATLGLALRGQWLRLFGMGMLFGAAMQTLVFVEELLFGHVRVAATAPFANDVKVIGVAAVVFVVAALTEEMSMRGYILQNLWEEWGFVPAAILSSLGFALLHSRNPHAHEQSVLTAAGLIAFGVWASLSVLWTKSLWLALGCHAAWNLFEGPVYGFPVSGIRVPAETAFAVSGGAPNWLTGGNFGPEAGLSSISAIVAGGVLLWLLQRRGVFDRA